jgi:hypothetical protein
LCPYQSFRWNANDSKGREGKRRKRAI